MPLARRAVYGGFSEIIMLSLLFYTFGILHNKKRGEKDGSKPANFKVVSYEQKSTKSPKLWDLLL